MSSYMANFTYAGAARVLLRFGRRIRWTFFQKPRGAQLKVADFGHGIFVTAAVDAKPPIRVLVSVLSVVVIWHGKVLDGG